MDNQILNENVLGQKLIISHVYTGWALASV